MTGLDTNILLRYFVQDDPIQSPIAKDLLESHLSESDPGYISTVALAETVWALTSTYRYTNEEVLAVLEHMLQAESLVLQNEPQVFEAAMEMKAGRGSFPDALIGALNASAGCDTTLTFDRGAARMSRFSLLPRR